MILGLPVAERAERLSRSARSLFVGALASLITLGSFCLSSSVDIRSVINAEYPDYALFLINAEDHAVLAATCSSESSKMRAAISRLA